MIWLYIYLGSVVVSTATSMICQKNRENKVAKLMDGEKNEKSNKEKIENVVSTILFNMIPVFNIIGAVVNICLSKEIYNEYEADIIAEQEIAEYKKIEEDKKHFESRNNKIVRPELTREEKLQNLYAEREKAIIHANVDEIGQSRILNK